VTNWKAVSPEHRKKIAPIVKHYMKEAHPFTACVRDNRKRFPEPGRAERICAVVKDMGKRTTTWRRNTKLRESGTVVGALQEAFDPDAYVAEIFDAEWAPVLDAEQVTVDELADWSQMATTAGIVESPLTVDVEIGDLSLLEVSAGQSLSARGRVSAGTNPPKPPTKVKQIAASSTPKKTRSGGSGAYDEKKHPRGRGGSWTIKAGASGEDVRTVQRQVGAKADGSFGERTKQKVMDFQRKHGLQVDGIVGHQTATALAGHFDAARTAKVGALKGSDRQKLATLRKPARVRESALMIDVELGAPLRESGALTLTLDGNMMLVEADAGEIREAYDLALVETTDGHGALLALVESAVPSTVEFNADGTIDFVIIRPCNGRGTGNRIYEAAVLERDAQVFTGWPVYDNHESPEAARARRGIPRPPSQLAGEIRESFWDPTFTTPDDAKMDFGQGAVIGRFMLTEDMEKLVRRLPRAVRTSVNAQATGMHIGTRNGKRGMIVEGFVDDRENSSVDLVTKAGAGGQVASLYRQMAAA
jgi:hypothetical protein